MKLMEIATPAAPAVNWPEDMITPTPHWNLDPTDEYTAYIAGIQLFLVSRTKKSVIAACREVKQIVKDMFIKPSVHAIDRNHFVLEMWMFYSAYEDGPMDEDQALEVMNNYFDEQTLSVFAKHGVQVVSLELVEFDEL
jgi:hypothetical protein